MGCSLRPPPCRHSSSTTGASIVSDEVLSKFGGSLNSNWGSSRVSDEPRRNSSFGARVSIRELPPSRADETDNWGTAKKPLGGGGVNSNDWNKKKGESNVSKESVGAGGGRPRLVLQPLSLSVSNEGGMGMWRNLKGQGDRWR
ncbi:hypothetical protein V8G54_015180 [Vigna mungo]|uniref:Uncharacterized protein n=1 Tax=Vigna mungo TaxID=3915 RepID=A0AAQ3NI18_VIGMU